MKSHRELFAETYTQAFQDTYPELPIEKSVCLIKKAIEKATADIRVVIINAPAFRLTAKRLGDSTYV